MRLARSSFRIALGAGELLRLDRARGVEVECEAGQVWITEEASAQDVWLGAGERVHLAGRGLALVEAHGAARVRLAEA